MPKDYTEEELDEILGRLENAERLATSGALPTAVAQFVPASLGGTQPTPEGYQVPGMALRNFPRSFMGTLDDTWNAITNPIDTAKALGSLAEGLVHKVPEDSSSLILRTAAGPFSRLLNAMTGNKEQSLRAVDAVGEAMKDRYGGMDEIKRTLAYDPAGALLDVAGLTGVPGAARYLAKAGAGGLGNLRDKAVNSLSDRYRPSGSDALERGVTDKIFGDKGILDDETNKYFQMERASRTLAAKNDATGRGEWKTPEGALGKISRIANAPSRVAAHIPAGLASFSNLGNAIVASVLSEIPLSVTRGANKIAYRPNIYDRDTTSPSQTSASAASAAYEKQVSAVLEALTKANKGESVSPHIADDIRKNYAIAGSVSPSLEIDVGEAIAKSQRMPSYKDTVLNDIMVKHRQGKNKASPSEYLTDEQWRSIGDKGTGEFIKDVADTRRVSAPDIGKAVTALDNMIGGRGNKWSEVGNMMFDDKPWQATKKMFEGRKPESADMMPHKALRAALIGKALSDTTPRPLGSLLAGTTGIGTALSMGNPLTAAPALWAMANTTPMMAGKIMGGLGRVRRITSGVGNKLAAVKPYTFQAGKAENTISEANAEHTMAALEEAARKEAKEQADRVLGVSVDNEEKELDDIIRRLEAGII